ncbi:hypothetical protein KFK09_020343 [Dendrobium nobile]|uniref:Uncharacterized protein n=1 Tax=Dendrobium nobile TaxID=94219 RepID=A0A8T3ATI5_DENNO|nr:hypothetical protein KFK09_020343 [Dendrobium nobile]
MIVLRKRKYRCFVPLHLTIHSSSVSVCLFELIYLEDSVPKQIPKPDPGQSVRSVGESRPGASGIRPGRVGS